MRNYLSNIFILFLLFIFSLSACSPKQPEIQATTSTIENNPIKETVEPSTTAEPTVTPTFTPEPSVDLPTPEYQISVIYDYAAHIANIQENIQYQNHSVIPIEEIIFATDPLRYPGVFILKSLLVNEEEYSNFELGHSFIKLPLSKPLLPKEIINIDIEFTLNLPSISNPEPDQKPGIFGYTVLQSNFVDWYPFIPPLSENGEWQLHDPWFFGEYLVYDLADYYVNIEILNAPENTAIAASALPISENGSSYSFEHKGARNFVWSTSPSFVIKSDQVNDITVTSYFFDFNRAAGEQALVETVKALAYYENWFGPYPHDSLAVVEADFLDGMEYDGLYFLSKGFYNLYDGTPQGYLTTIAVHETAHQWWYTKVANDQAIEPWLDEALCTYTELLFYEAEYPELTNWWWEYRVNYYHPQGAVNMPIYDYAGFTPYRDATYLQGARFVHLLRENMGDEDFFAFLEAYATQYAGKIATAENFWGLVATFNPNVEPYLSQQFFLFD